MGISSAPDIFQAVMTGLLDDLDFCRVYIDDILIVSNGTFKDHMEKLHKVLKRLEDAGFHANARKCFFARDELEYLGYCARDYNPCQRKWKRYVLDGSYPVPSIHDYI
jgi:hypothetical protein